METNYMETTSVSAAGSRSYRNHPEKLNYFNFSRSLRHGTGCRYHKKLYGNTLLAGNYAGIYAELSSLLFCFVNTTHSRQAFEILKREHSNLNNSNYVNILECDVKCIREVGFSTKLFI